MTKENNRNREWLPAPINTTDIELSDDMKELAERIARNIHEVWGAARKNEGWTWGPQRDDEKLETPNMVPYDELTECERDYDRRTVTETIKTLLYMGYDISKKK